jgi:hypothetical protein
MMQERKAQRKGALVCTPADRRCPCKSVSFRVMADSNNSAQSLGDIIDYIEKVREELLTIQRSLEKLESAKSAAPEPRRVSK